MSTAPHADSPVDAALERELGDAVVAEAALLDGGRWDEWLALWTDDARYWVPLGGADQSDDKRGQSLADDDRLLLALRVERLKHPRAHSLKPHVGCQHVLQPSRIERANAAEALLRTPFVYVEAQGAHEIMLTGSARHRLLRAGTGWKIREKRVDLLNAARPLPAIQLFI
ncbi:MAG TPA: aromatic-ring-hydroxylating dioxygenase subunit beta [Caldimonas sp.]|nr:aromatic-ring-hydroxylating dioxygenase subunit beta [Caldimonas sp.]